MPPDNRSITQSLNRLIGHPQYYAPLPGPWPLTPSPSSPPALYLHIPFCSVKCHYCDFYSLAHHLHLAGPFLQALDTELALLTAHFGPLEPETIFIGGGTPTFLPLPLLARLLTILHRHINPARLTEFTVESNPNTFSPEHARILAGHRVNRLSFGAQSFVPAELAALQRDHDPDSVARACATARHAGITNLNLDLIFGIPGQTLRSWDFSLTHALALSPTHLACYDLIYEPATPLTARLQQGQITPLPEDLELALFQHTYQKLRAANFTRYEISNYALNPSVGATSVGATSAGATGLRSPQTRAEGGATIDDRRPTTNDAGPFACHHNLHYWLGHDYLAAGPSAASSYQGHRWKNIPSLTHYLTALLPGSGATGLRSEGVAQTRAPGAMATHPFASPCDSQSDSTLPNRVITDSLNHQSPCLPISSLEHLPPLRHAGELAILRLRLAQGLCYADFIAQTHLDPRPYLAPILQKYATLDVLEPIPHARAPHGNAVLDPHPPTIFTGAPHGHAALDPPTTESFLTAAGLRLTDTGIPVSNTILADILAAFPDR